MGKMLYMKLKNFIRKKSCVIFNSLKWITIYKVKFGSVSESI